MLPKIAFEDYELTSCADTVVFQPIPDSPHRTQRLRCCFKHPTKVSHVFQQSTIVMPLVVHLLIGYRRLPDPRYY